MVDNFTPFSHINNEEGLVVYRQRDLFALNYCKLSDTEYQFLHELKRAFGDLPVESYGMKNNPPGWRDRYDKCETQSIYQSRIIESIHNGILRTGPVVDALTKGPKSEETRSGAISTEQPFVDLSESQKNSRRQKAKPSSMSSRKPWEQKKTRLSKKQKLEFIGSTPWQR